jgi:ribosomal-protein-alanine N-acetyltransferase
MDKNLQDLPATVRYATEADLEATIEIERLSFPHPWEYDYHKEALKDLFIVYDEGGVLGYVIAVCYHRYSKAMIMKLAVHPDHRGRGIALDLIERIIEVLKQAGITEVEIDAKMIGKGPVSLYEKFGFRVAETVSVEDESEDVYFHTMTLRLAKAKDRPPDPTGPAALSCSTTAAQEDDGPSPPPPGGECVPAR